MEEDQISTNLKLVSPEKVLFKDQVIFNGEHFHIGQDWEVPIPGFFIVAAKRKGVSSIEDFTDAESQEFMTMLRKMRKGMREVLGIKHVYFFQNEDTQHGFHFWLFPRLDWMEQFGRKIESVRPIMDFALANRTDEKSREEVRAQAALMREFYEKSH